MSISQKTKESIADALAVAIQDAAAMEARKRTTKPTHYGVRISNDGYVQIDYAAWPDGEHPGKGWIPLDE